MYSHIWQFPLKLLAIIKFRFWFWLVSICTEEFEFLDSVDLSVVAFSVETVIPSLSFQWGDLYHSCIHAYVFMFNVLLRAYIHIFWEHSTNSVFTYIISLLPTGGLMLFIYMYLCSMYFIYIYVNISGAFHKFCIYIHRLSPSIHIFTYIFSCSKYFTYIHIWKYFWSTPQNQYSHLSCLCFQRGNLYHPCRTRSSWRRAFDPYNLL